MFETRGYQSAGLLREGGSSEIPTFCYQHGWNYSAECDFCKDGDQTVKSDGGPSSYYDLDPAWVTWNDVAEHKAKTQWGAYSLHMKDLSKAMMRFGVKDGTSVEYDVNKMFYSTVRLKVMQGGKKAAREMLERMLSDPQMK